MNSTRRTLLTTGAAAAAVAALRALEQATGTAMPLSRRIDR